MSEINIDRLRNLHSRIVEEQHSFSGCFYAKLFESEPNIEKLFKSVGMKMQGKMVIQALGIGIKSYDKQEDFASIFKSLGRRHGLYGVQSDFYPHIVQAIIETCKASFGSDFDEELESDMQVLLRNITTQMKLGDSGASKTQSTDRRFHRSMESPDDPYLARFLKNRAIINRPPQLPEVEAISEPVSINYLGEKSVNISPMQTILEASHSNDIPHIWECGGSARCSTCRVMIVDGLENCLPRTTLEKRLAARKGFYPEIRLACQTRVVGDVTLKRLVRDEADIELAIAGSIGEAGKEITGAVLFTDIWGFTAFSEANLPYDVIHSLNLLFRSLGQAVDDHDGYVDKYIGDSLMAIFGLGGESAEESCRNAVMAASSMLASLPQVNSNLRKYLGDEFRLGIGIAYGPMVTGELGFALKRQFTAVGDTVNIAARLESETRKTQVNLLISDSVKTNLLSDWYELMNTFEFDLKGKTQKVVAHAILVRT